MDHLINDRSTGIYIWMCRSIQIHTAYYTIKILEGDNTDVPRKKQRNKHHIQGYGGLQF